MCTSAALCKRSSFWFAMACNISYSSLADSCSVGGGESKAKVEAISDLMRFQNFLIDDGRVSMVEHWLDRFWCSIGI